MTHIATVRPRPTVSARRQPLRAGFATRVRLHLCNGPVEEVPFCPAISGSEPVAINLYNDASYRREPLKFDADRRIADEQKQEAVECDGQPLQINGRSGQEGLNAHIVQSSAHCAGEAVPCLGFPCTPSTRQR